MQKKKNLRSALQDLSSGAGYWRIWTVLAIFDIRARYRRSKLGQFWITLSMAVTICCLGAIYSVIFKIPLREYLPLVAISYITWGLIASLVTEGANVFIESEGYVRSSPLPKSMFVYRMLARNTMIFGHNLVLVPIVMLVFGIPPNWSTLLFIPAFMLAMMNGIWAGLLLGTLCARFRDLPQIIASIVQIAFFASPVMWGRMQLAQDKHLIIDLNPFAIFLELLRDPLLGKSPQPQLWVSACAITVFGFFFTLPFFARFRARIAYYL